MRAAGKGGPLRATYTLTLVRHGQSTWNLENRFTGWTDVGLSPQGEQEALQGENFSGNAA